MTRTPLSASDITDASEPLATPRPRGRDHRRGSHNKSARTYSLTGNRDFCVWDGEGVNEEGVSAQAYCLLGNSEGGMIRSSTFSYLTSEEIFSFLMTEKKRLPFHIHTGYAIKYDSNMFLRTVPYLMLKRLFSTGSVTFKGWRISYRPGKYFMLTDLKLELTIKIYDMLSFWSMKAVDACIQDPRIGADDPRVIFIAPTKDDRGTFTTAQMDSKVIPYFKVEMELYKELISNLRNALAEVNLIPGEWFGPSAVVSTLYRKRGLKRFMARPESDLTRWRGNRHGQPIRPDKAFSYTLPDVVNRIGLDSFFGGRFELFQLGVHDGPAYEYDINSAYPAAMCHLPQLSDGVWRHYSRAELTNHRKAGRDIPGSGATFGFYRVWYRFEDDLTALALFQATGRLPPHPFAHRGKDMSVSFPQEYLGWSPYWSAMAVWKNIPQAEFLEAWVWEPSNDFKPFASGECVNVPEMFAQRNHFGKTGRPDLKYVLKITLNSGYGKLAQTVGTKWGDNLPPYHQMEWASHITDYCRARMWGLASRAYAQESLVSIETDALFTTLPIPAAERECGDGLGDFKRIDFDGLIYVQSGIYFTRSGDEWTFHYRGLNRDSLSAETIGDYFSSVDVSHSEWSPIKGANTVFNTASMSGIRFDRPQEFYDKWLSWENAERLVTPSKPALKRMHAPGMCLACKAGLSPAQTMHDMVSKVPLGMVSAPRKAEWLGDKLTSEERDKLDFFEGREEVFA